ncbi:MAG: YybS family protein [Geobacteraceae bacterium]|nr:YybS family protein [Geobacteraceae bacterium]
MGLPGKDLLLDAVKGAVLTLALFLAYVTFPVFGLPAGIFAPLPSLYYYLKRGARTAVFVFAITTMVLTVLGDTSVPLLFLLQSGIIGIILPFFYLQGKGTARAIAYAVGLNFMLIVVLAVAYTFWSGSDLQVMLIKGIETSSEQAIKMYSTQGLPAHELDQFSQGIRQAAALIGRVFPALVLVSMISIAAINMAVVFRMQGKFLPAVASPSRLTTFKNPDLLVWVVIAAGFGMLVPHPDTARIALNVLVVAGFIYFLQGLAVVLAFFERITVPSLARVIFWLFLLFQPYLVLAISFLGLFDVWGDFRTPKQKNL